MCPIHLITHCGSCYIVHTRTALQYYVVWRSRPLQVGLSLGARPSTHERGSGTQTKTCLQGSAPRLGRSAITDYNTVTKYRSHVLTIVV